MTAAEQQKRLSALLKRLRQDHPDAEAAAASTIAGTPAWSDPIIDELILAFMQYDATSSQARLALKRIREAVVDYNELRVMFTDELVGVIGERYPRAAERAERLRAALRDIYRREHAVALASLAESSKRDASSMLMSIEGVVQYVVARVTLVALGGHALPVDDRLHALLVSEGVIGPDATLAESASWLERQVRAPEALPTHALLQAWSDAHGSSVPTSLSKSKKRKTAPAEVAATGRPPRKRGTKASD